MNDVYAERGKVALGPVRAALQAMRDTLSEDGDINFKLTRVLGSLTVLGGSIDALEAALSPTVAEIHAMEFAAPKAEEAEPVEEVEPIEEAPAA